MLKFFYNLLSSMHRKLLYDLNDLILPSYQKLLFPLSHVYLHNFTLYR